MPMPTQAVHGVFVECTHVCEVSELGLEMYICTGFAGAYVCRCMSARAHMQPSLSTLCMCGHAMYDPMQIQPQACED